MLLRNIDMAGGAGCKQLANGSRGAITGWRTKVWGRGVWGRAAVLRSAPAELAYEHWTVAQGGSDPR